MSGVLAAVGPVPGEMDAEETCPTVSFTTITADEASQYRDWGRRHLREGVDDEHARYLGIGGGEWA